MTVLNDGNSASSPKNYPNNCGKCDNRYKNIKSIHAADYCKEYKPNTRWIDGVGCPHHKSKGA